uniref:RNA-binding protein 42 n=1 Tax=Sphaerodactylus townsendi TaxID=933632 RepID=A0ACB8FS31_9SAUR
MFRGHTSHLPLLLASLFPPFLPDDFRIFCGDLGNEVNDDILARAFSRYPSFLKAKVIRDKRTGKTKGYGFVSFKDPNDYVRAMREMNGKYVGSRPIKLRKSMWKDRNIDVVRKKQKEKKKLGLRGGVCIVLKPDKQERQLWLEAPLE